MSHGPEQAQAEPPQPPRWGGAGGGYWWRAAALETGNKAVLDSAFWFIPKLFPPPDEAGLLHAGAAHGALAEGGAVCDGPGVVTDDGGMATDIIS